MPMPTVTAFNLSPSMMMTRSRSRLDIQTSPKRSTWRARSTIVSDQPSVKRRARSRSISASAIPADESTLRSDLRTRLLAASDPSYQAYISRYLRSDSVLGVRMPGILSATNEWAAAHDLPSRDSEEAKQLALQLFEASSVEEKCAASMFLQTVGKRGAVGVEDLPRLARLFDDGFLSGWAVTDAFCSRVLKGIVQRGKDDAVQGIADWRDAQCLWRARASVVGLLPVVKTEDGRKVVLQCCDVLIKRDERFAKTAVGWAMREMTKHDKEAVLLFVGRYKEFFSLESVRNATKRCTDDEKKTYVHMVKEAVGGRTQSAENSFGTDD